MSVRDDKDGMPDEVRDALLQHAAELAEACEGHARDLQDRVEYRRPGRKSKRGGAAVRSRDADMPRRTSRGCDAAVPWRTSRVDAAAATWICRGGRVAAATRICRGGRVAAAAQLFRGNERRARRYLKKFYQDEAAYQARLRWERANLPRPGDSDDEEVEEAMAGLPPPETLESVDVLVLSLCGYFLW